MTTLSESVWNSLRESEGYSSTIYSDGKGIPTIGVGFALIVKSGSTYSLRSDWRASLISMGITNETFLNSIETGLGQAKDKLNGVGSFNPFPNTTSSPSIANVYGSVSETNFKSSAWPEIYQSYLAITIERVGYRVWNALAVNEQTALYSLVYNNPSLIGTGILGALNIYTSGSTDNIKFIGKLEVWNQILYNSNAKNEYGVQNRRFFEANEFLGISGNNKPNNISEAKSIIPIKNLMEANIAIAYMNKYKDNMAIKLDKITDYGNNNGNKKEEYDYIRDNFSEAIEKIFFYNNYKDSYDLSKLFTEWNVLTDLTINTVDGSTSYGTVTGTDLKDIIFLTSNQDNSKENGGDGDDEIYGNLYNANILYGNGGNDIIKAGIKNDTVDGGYIEDTSEHANKILLGAGSDTYNGGIGKDTTSPSTLNSCVYISA